MGLFGRKKASQAQLGELMLISAGAARLEENETMNLVSENSIYRNIDDGCDDMKVKISDEERKNMCMFINTLLAEKEFLDEVEAAIQDNSFQIPKYVDKMYVAVEKSFKESGLT